MTERASEQSGRLETRFFAAGRGSGVPVEAMIYNVWTVRQGKAVRVHGHLSRPQALKAAGRRE